MPLPERIRLLKQECDSRIDAMRAWALPLAEDEVDDEARRLQELLRLDDEDGRPVNRSAHIAHVQEMKEKLERAGKALADYEVAKGK